MGKKYIIEKDDNESIWSIYAGADGDATIEGVSLTPYTEPDPEQVKADAYSDGYKAGREAERVRQPDLEQVRKEGYEKGYETAKHECEDCNTNIVVEAIRKEAYEKAYEQGRKDGKIEGQAEVWVCVKKIAFKPEIAECVDDLVRIGFDVGTADSWSEAIELLFEKYTAYEAIEKIRQYEQEKEEIKVGDEVINRNKKAVVTEITDRFVRIMYSDGSGYALFSENMTKTGRTFPEISEVLQKMKETDNG